MRYLLRDLSPGQLYALQVRGENGGEVSAWSRIFNFTTDIDQIAPLMPTGFTGAVKGTSFTAVWNAVTINSDGSPLTDFDHYEVRVTSPNSGASAVYNTTETKFELSFENNVTTFGTPQGVVSLSVCAVDAVNNSSDYTVPVVLTNAAPAPPTNFVANGVQDGIDTRWTGIVDVDNDLKDYRIYTGTTAGFTPAAGNLVWSGRATSALIRNTAYNTDAYYKIATYDVFNTPSTFVSVGPVRPSSPFTVDTTGPVGVSGLAATITTDADGSKATATVTWTANSTDTDLAGYAIQYREVGTTNYTTVKADKDQNSFVVTPIKPYVNYEFKIRAYDWAANYGPMSATVTTNTAATNTAPATVTGVTITGGKDSVTVAWTENTEPDVANGAGMYLVDIATNAAFSTGLLSYKTGATNITVTGLAQGTAYYARVKAVDSRGLASASWSTAPNTSTGTISQFTYTTGATAPSNPKTGDIWMDTGTGFEKQWSGTAWVNTGNASTSYVDSKTNSLVKTYSNEYASNASETVAPTTGWSTTAPTRTPGTFVWMRSVITLGDGTTSTTSPALLTGNTGATGNTGPTGNPGSTGATGVGISSVTPYFAQVATGSAAPAKPTTATPSAPWVLTEPDYVASTELYRTEKVLYTDATFAYTSVTKVSSYAAAATAIASANGKNKVIHSTGTPGTTANIAGDTWVQYDGSNNIIAQFRGNGGTSWTQESVASAFIANLDAGKLTANSAFITTLNIGTGGAIQSAGYTSGGTSGFQLSNSGLIIKGSGNTVDAGVLKGGTITGTTINVGASGVLNIDSTAVVKSNNYSANSTGYQLSSSGLEINDGSINAKTLKSGTIDTATLTLSGPNGKIVGTGFSLAGSGLVIDTGSIAAAALKIQIGQNLMPVQYSDFEFAPTYYTGKIGTTGGSFTINTNAAFVRGGTQSICAIGNPSATSNMSFGTNGTSSYNVPVNAGTTYIFSAYIWNASTAGNPQPNLRFRLKETAAYISVSGATTIPTGQWTRVSGAYTIPSGITAVTAYIDWQAFTGNVYVDQVQLEEQVGSLTTPSSWTPPSSTSIDGGYLRTGEVRSTTNVTVNGATQPAFSLNIQGNMQIGDGLVRGKLVIGNIYNPINPDGSIAPDPDLGASYAQSGSYVPGKYGWIIKSDGFAEFRNLAINSLKVTTLDSPLQNVIATKLYDYMEDGSLWANRSWTGLVDAAILRKNNEAGAFSAKSLIQFTGDGAVSRDALGVNSGIAFEPEVLYRVAARVRQVSGDSAGAPVTKASIGVLGYNDAFVLAGYDGTNDITKQYMVAADAVDLGVFDGTASTDSSGWQTYVGYIKGRGVVGTAGAAPDMYAPAQVHESVRYLVPYVRMNQGNTTYIAQLDFFSIETFEAGAQQKIATNPTGQRSITIENMLSEPTFNHAIRFYTGANEELKPGIFSMFQDGDAEDSLSLIISTPVSTYSDLDYSTDNITLRGTNANMMYNHSFAEGITGWIGWNANSSVSFNESDGRDDTTSLQIDAIGTVTATTTIGAQYNMDPTNFDGVAGAARIIASAYIKPINKDTPIEGRIYVRGTAEDGTLVNLDGGSGYSYSVRTTCPVGEWTRVVISTKGYAPIGDIVDFIQVGWYNNTTSAAGDQFLIDDVQVEVYDYDKYVRKNWFPNPNFVDSPVTGIPNGMVAYTSGTPTGTRAVVSGVMQLNNVAFTAASQQRFGNYMDCPVDPSNNDRQVSVKYTKTGGNASVRVSYYVDCYDDNSVIVTSGSSLPTYASAASGTITYDIPGDASITRIRAYFWVDANSTITSGVSATFTQPMIADESPAGTFFSGSSTGAMFAGVTNASPSILMTPTGTIPTVDQMASDVKGASASQAVINADSLITNKTLILGDNPTGILPPTTDFYSIKASGRPDVAASPLIVLQSQTTNYTFFTMDDFNSTGLYRSGLDIRGWGPDGIANSPGIRLFNSNDEYSPGRFALISPGYGYTMVTYDKFGSLDPDTMMSTPDFRFYGFSNFLGAPPWQTMTPLSSGWAHYSSAYTGGFYSNFDKVYLRGIIQRTGSALAVNSATVTVMTLPSGYRPAQNVYVPVTTWGGGAIGTALLLINTAGNVSFYSNSAVLNTNGWFTMEGASFSMSADTSYTPGSTPAADTTAPGAPSSLTISAYSSGTKTGAYKIGWKNSSATDFAGAKIIWRSDRYPSVSIASSGTKKLTTDGHVITITGGSGATKSYLHSGIPVNHYIYYRVVCYDKTGNHSGYISGRRYLLASPFVVGASSSGSYRDGYGGGWRSDTDDVYQGEYSGYNDNHRGLFFYGSSIYSKLNSGGVRRTPTKIAAYVYRQNSSHGTAAAEGLNLGTHTYTSRPGGVPTVSNIVDSITTLGRGQGKTINLPSSWYSGFASGSRRGIGIYSSSSADYLIMTGHHVSPSNGKLTIYHKG